MRTLAHCSIRCFSPFGVLACRPTSLFRLARSGQSCMLRPVQASKALRLLQVVAHAMHLHTPNPVLNSFLLYCIPGPGQAILVSDHCLGLSPETCRRPQSLALNTPCFLCRTLPLGQLCPWTKTILGCEAPRLQFHLLACASWGFPPQALGAKKQKSLLAGQLRRCPKSRPAPSSSRWTSGWTVCPQAWQSCWPVLQHLPAQAGPCAPRPLLGGGG